MLPIVQGAAEDASVPIALSLLYRFERVEFGGALIGVVWSYLLEVFKTCGVQAFQLKIQPQRKCPWKAKVF